jgi:hypothetical protein
LNPDPFRSTFPGAIFPENLNPGIAVIGERHGSFVVFTFRSATKDGRGDNVFSAKSGG